MNTVRFDSQQENVLLIPKYLPRVKQPSSNNSYATSEDQALRLKFTESKIISQSQERIKKTESKIITLGREQITIPFQENIYNKERDSLGDSYFNAKTSQSSINYGSSSLFSLSTSEKSDYHQNLLQQKNQYKYKFEREKIINQKLNSQFFFKPNVIKQNYQAKGKQENPQDKDSRYKNLWIPSPIYDVGTVQINQQSQGMSLQNPLQSKSSQNTTNKICNQDYQSRGFFIPTDTDAGDKVKERGEQSKKNISQSSQSQPVFGIQCQFLSSIINFFLSQQKNQSRLGSQQLIIGNRKGNFITKKDRYQRDYISKTY